MDRRQIGVQPVRVPKTAELVAGSLRRRIVRGELAEGDALPPEPELMEQFGVSRPTLREAFRVLEAESLITVRRGSRGGARVHLPDLSVAGRYSGLLLQVRGTTLDDVFVARLVLEPAAARMVAEHRDAAAIARLDEAIDAEERDVEDPPRFALSSAHFHELLVEETGNKTLSILMGTIMEIIESSTSHTIALSMVTSEQAVENARAVRAHRKLMRLIGQGDAPGAERFWTTHMGHVRQRFSGHYGSATVIDLFE